MSRVGRIINGSNLDQVQVVDLHGLASWSDIILGRIVSDSSSGVFRSHKFDGNSNDDVYICRYADPFFYRKTLMRHLLQLIGSFLRKLDTESVTTFQSMYYVVFTLAAALMVVKPDMHAFYVSESLGRYYYDMWLIATLVCPPMTLIGRRLMTLAARVHPGGANPAYGAAWLQLAGDIGVWGTVLVYVTSMMITDWWSKELYTFGFLLMGVAGGGMFTLRSARRIMQIERRNRAAVWKT